MLGRPACKLCRRLMMQPMFALSQAVVRSLQALLPSTSCLGTFGFRLRSSAERCSAPLCTWEGPFLHLVLCLHACCHASYFWGCDHNPSFLPGSRTSAFPRLTRMCARPGMLPRPLPYRTPTPAMQMGPIREATRRLAAGSAHGACAAHAPLWRWPPSEPCAQPRAAAARRTQQPGTNARLRVRLGVRAAACTAWRLCCMAAGCCFLCCIMRFATVGARVG